MPDEEPALSLSKGPHARLQRHLHQEEFPPQPGGDFDFVSLCGFHAEIKFAVVLPECDGAVSEWSDGERGGRTRPQPRRGGIQ